MQQSSFSPPSGVRGDSIPEASTEVGSIEPLLASSSRGRRRQISFYYFLVLPHRPEEGTDLLLPLNRREWKGVAGLLALFSGLLLLFFSVFHGLTAIMLFPFFYLFCGGIFLYLRYRSFQRDGPIAELERILGWVKWIFGNESRLVAHILYQMGRVSEILGRPEEALKYYQAIPTTISAFAIHASGAPYQHVIGCLCFRLGKYDLAIEAFQIAVRLRKLNRADRFRLQKEINWLASTKEKVGDLDGALQCRLEAVQVLEHKDFSNTMDYASCLVSIGSTYELMGQLENALEQYMKGLNICILNEGEFPRGNTTAGLHAKIGNVQEKMGNVEMAVEQFCLSIEVYRRGGKSDDNRAVAALLQRVANLKASSAV